MHPRVVLLLSLCALAHSSTGCLTAVAAFQPEDIGGPTIVLTTTGTEGKTYERVLSPIDAGDQLFVSEEITSAETGGVHDHCLAQRHEIATGFELARDDAAPEQQDVFHESVEVDRRLELHMRLPCRVRQRKRMLARAEKLGAGP